MQMSKFWHVALVYNYLMALTTRLIKQIAYGTTFLVGLVFVISGLTVITRPEAAPTPTPAPVSLFESIVLEDVSLIEHTHKPGEAVLVDAIARLRNPNPRAGIADFPITFTFVSQAGQIISTETASVYLLPSSLAYAVNITATLPTSPARVDVTFPVSPTFTTIPASVSLPRFGATLHPRTTKAVGETVIEEQKGLVTNLSALDWQFVEVVGVALSNSGRPIAVGQTFMGELRTGEAREFTLQWPAPAEVVARVIVLPTTNIYRQENIIRAIGDPSLLR